MKTKIRLYMGTIIGGGFLAMMATLIFVPMPRENADVLKILTGFMGGAFLTMVSFYFGDSEGR